MLQKREEVAGKVLVEVKEIRRSQQKVGTRKLQKMLSISVGRDRLFHLLRNEGLLVKRRKSYHKTTDSKHWYKRYPNLIKERLPKQPGEQLVSDITYISVKQGHGYLSLITDRYSRKIVGYGLSDNLTSASSQKALEMAFKKEKLKPDFIHHSDQGKQYGCWEYVDLVKSRGGQMSMTEEDHVYENAMAERMNGILKQEFGLDARFNTFKEAKKAVKESISIYNNKRLHLALNYKTPSEVHGDSCPVF